MSMQTVMTGERASATKGPDLLVASAAGVLHNIEISWADITTGGGVTLLMTADSTTKFYSGI